MGREHIFELAKEMSVHGSEPYIISSSLILLAFIVFYFGSLLIRRNETALAIFQGSMITAILFVFVSYVIPNYI